MKLNSGNGTLLFYIVFFICLRKDFRNHLLLRQLAVPCSPVSQMKLVAQLSSARSGTALAHKEWGLAKLLAASPGVYLCLEDLLFLTFSPYLLHLLSTSRAAERSIWNFAANSSSAEHALEHPALLGLNPLGT